MDSRTNLVAVYRQLEVHSVIAGEYAARRDTAKLVQQRQHLIVHGRFLAARLGRTGDCGLPGRPDCQNSRRAEVCDMAKRQKM